MNYLYWIAVVISVIAFGGMSRTKRSYVKLDRIWVPLYLLAYIAAVWLSGKILSKEFILTAVILFFGNALLWGIIWS
jgi:hypothetical protein